MGLSFKKGSDTYDVANRIRDFLLEDGLDEYSNVMNELQKNIEISIIISEDEE